MKIESLNIKFQVKSKKLLVDFNVLTNLGDMVENAIINWSERTDEFTCESFCEYVESKGVHSCEPDVLMNEHADIFRSSITKR
jgi:hypothetical protein